MYVLKIAFASDQLKAVTSPLCERCFGFYSGLLQRADTAEVIYFFENPFIETQHKNRRTTV